MTAVGSFSLVLAWGLAVFGVVFGALGGVKKDLRFTHASRNALILIGLCLILSLVGLWDALLRSDFSILYVWQFSNRDMPWVYKFSALWGGMDGSMLLWSSVLGLGSSIAALRIFEDTSREGSSWALSILHVTNLFFLTVTTFLTNPFTYIKSDVIPLDGNGLNPLLQNPLMAVHPPIMYGGLTLFAIPFSLCIGALIARQQGSEWLRAVRTWTLIPWGFLTAGKVLGGLWAYVELGWGGFWAWDPVENASFLPWLTGTAFLHSAMVQERKDMLKTWNVWLITLTYGLTVFGTFLTRSGIVQSVHAFASTDIGWVFLLYLGIIIFGVLYISIIRRDVLKPSRHIESVLSREAAFLMNNLVLLSITFSTLWGVMFPVLSEAITGVKQTVGVPYFNAVNVPQFLFLMFLMGVGPLIAWRNSSIESIRKLFLTPLLLALCIGAVLIWGEVGGFYTTLAYSLCAFVFGTILSEMYRNLRAQRGAAPFQSLAESGAAAFRRHRRIFGGHIVHLGVVVVVIGITASMAHKTERDFVLGIGETFSVSTVTVKLEDLTVERRKNHEALIAVTSVTDGDTKMSLSPESRFYYRNQETTSEVALYPRLKGDIYLVVAGAEGAGNKVALKLFINPLQSFLWAGTLIMILGTAVLLISSSKAAEAPEQFRDARSDVVRP